jgi:hypothetical protein
MVGRMIPPVERCLMRSHGEDIRTARHNVAKERNNYNTNALQDYRSTTVLLR